MTVIACMAIPNMVTEEGRDGKTQKLRRDVDFTHFQSFPICITALLLPDCLHAQPELLPEYLNLMQDVQENGKLRTALMERVWNIHDYNDCSSGSLDQLFLVRAWEGCHKCKL